MQSDVARLKVDVGIISQLIDSVDYKDATQVDIFKRVCEAVSASLEVVLKDIYEGVELYDKNRITEIGKAC